MTFEEIFKSSFLEKAVSVSILDMVIAMALSFVLGLFIFFIYKKTFQGVMYSAAFGVSLMAMSLITTVVILAVTSNVVLSLGMVGALSIVRFRTAIKEPMDIAFLFWSIAVGIVVGAGLIPLAIIGSVLIGIMLLIFVKKKSFDTPYILVVNCKNEVAEAEVLRYLGNQVKKSQLKSKTVSSGGIDMTLEVRLKDTSTEFVNTISGMENISNAMLVSYNGDYMS